MLYGLQDTMDTDMLYCWCCFVSIYICFYYNIKVIAKRLHKAGAPSVLCFLVWPLGSPNPLRAARFCLYWTSWRSVDLLCQYIPLEHRRFFFWSTSFNDFSQGLKGLTKFDSKIWKQSSIKCNTVLLTTLWLSRCEFIIGKVYSCWMP